MAPRGWRAHGRALEREATVRYRRSDEVSVGKSRELNIAPMILAPRGRIDPPTWPSARPRPVAIRDKRPYILVPWKGESKDLAELLAQCDPNAPLSAEDRAWLDAPAVGREAL